MAAPAFRKINLVPKTSFEYSSLGKIMKWSLTTGRVFVVLTEFVVILAFGSRFYYDKRLNDLSEVINQKMAVVDSYATIEKQTRKILTKQAVVDKFLQNNIGFTAKTASIKRVTPPDVVYDSISINADGFGMEGLAGSENSLALLVGGLTKINEVSSVMIDSIDYEQKSSKITFKISVKYKSKAGGEAK